jgi:hypothetical protein
MRWSDISQPVVYHSTDWGPEIVASGIIKGNPIRLLGHIKHARAQEGLTGVCVTRSMWFAKAYASVIFAIDLSKVRQRYKLIQRAEGAYDEAHDGDYRLEAEEFILCPKLDLDQYLRAIWMSEERRGDDEFEPVAQHPLFKGWFSPV